MTKTVNLYEAKTQLSRLVDEAAAGEEIVIAKNGVAKVKLVPVPAALEPRKPSNTMKITYIAPDFDAVDPEIVRLFEGD